MSKNGSRSLSDEAVREIRTTYSPKTIIETAVKHGVSQATIRKIALRQSHAWVEDEE